MIQKQNETENNETKKDIAETKRFYPTLVLKLSLISEEMRKDKENLYFEMCGLSSVYAYALTQKGYNLLLKLKKGRN